MISKPLPEILAPVGNWEMCRAAVHNGADAIYLGLPGFNARGRAELLDIDTLKEMIEFCHLYGTKVFIASNILIFEREIKDIQSLLYDIIPLAPDAFIVQDIGLIRLIHQICPEQVIHASTQMTVTNYEAIELTSDLFMQRYVLGRECSIAEVEKIRAKTDKELEVFVHGALCVSYSGQCLTSESFGGRSANRGQCAQSCRLDYELLVDGVTKEMGEKRYLVSPQDLCAIDDVGRLIEVGVDSFKIEGRLKSPQYVAETVRRYKAKVMHPDMGDMGSKKSLGLTYSRGFFNGWMDGVNHQRLVDGRYSNHHGIEIGVIKNVTKRGVIIKTFHDVAPGDGIVFADFKRKFELGASVYEVLEVQEEGVELRFSSDFDLTKIYAGMSVFVNASPSLGKELQRSWTVREEMRRIPLQATVEGAAGQPLKVSFSDQQGNEVLVSSDVSLEPAQKSALTTEKLIEVLGALGTTPFELRNVTDSLEGELFLHTRELKEIRRKAVDQLTHVRSSPSVKKLVDFETSSRWISSISTTDIYSCQTKSALNVLIRDRAQVEALSDLRLDTVYLDFEFGKEYAEAVSAIREMGFKVGIATTRILKPGELGHLKVIERLKPDVVLVRNLGALQYFRDKGATLAGDFSLNISNSLSADWFRSKGLATLCPSYDLNAEQLYDLTRAVPADCLEVTIHQYMPAFHMEHCVYAAFLSTGTSFRDCGRPCEKHRVELRDHTGALHPLKPDAECRNTMFNGTAQSGARVIPDLKERGVRRFRIEALFESATELREKILGYCSIVLDNAEPMAIMSQLGGIERFGVTEGQLFNIKSYRDKRKGASS